MISKALFNVLSLVPKIIYLSHLTEHLLKARIEASLDRKRWHDQEQAYLVQIEQERHKADQLLLNILPEPISERLKQGQEIIGRWL